MSTQPTRTYLAVAFGFLLVCLLMTAHPTAAQEPAPATAPPSTAPNAAPAARPATRPAAPKVAALPPKVEDVVAGLIAEADEAFKEDTRRLVTVARPHRLVARLEPRQADEVLRAMKGKLAGDPLKDAYVRYHLMDVVNRALPTAPEPFTQALLDLAPLVPADPPIELRPWHTYEPKEIGDRYRRLIDSCAVRVGFPPFHRTVWAPESFQYMDGPRRAKAEKDYAEALSLKGKFTEVDHPANHAYNWRQIRMNFMVRQYRGELLYAMVAQNDAKAFDRIIDAIAAAAANDPVRATDFASFLNAAYFNGILGRFDAKALKSAAAKLRSAAAASERAAREAASKGMVRGAKQAGPTMSVGWTNESGRWRQVPEALFTIVFGIENNRVPKPIDPKDFNRPPPTTLPATLPAGTTVSPDRLDVATIDAAIARGVAALEKLRPPDVDLNFNSYAALSLPNNYWHSDFTLPGQGALTTWALLGAGETIQRQWMQRRLNWVLAYDSPTTYDRAMRLQLLSRLKYSDLAPWIKRDAQWLVDTITDQGNWEQRNVGARSPGFGDNANGQYAMLGLWAAEQSGVVQFPDALWQRVDNYWRTAQRPPGAPGDGAWAVTSSASLKKGANLNDFSNRVSASMTAGGVLSLYLTEMYLHGPKRVEVGQSFSPELQRGVQWLDDNFSLDQLDGDSDFYFYAWTIQNVGQATGYRTFNDVDWFRNVTARLLNTQRPDGLWAGPKGTHVSTSFALLYLARARGPLAICKVRFDPTYDPRTAAAAASAAAAGKPAKRRTNRDLAKANAWNNRPNDLYNFAVDVSEKLEVPTSWQIADLDQPVHELVESAVLYLATDRAFKLPPAEVARLREYVDAGGLLVCVPEGKSALAPLNAMKALAAELSPGIEPVRRTEHDHPFYKLGAKLKGTVATLSYETPIRPRVVIVEKDLGRELQANKPTERDAFDLLTNLYLFASGRNPSRPRIASSHLLQRNADAPVKFAVARVKYDGGDFDPEPLALPQLKAFLADRHNVGLNVLPAAAASELDAKTRVAFVSVTAGAAPSDADAAALAKWVEAGGTLWVDAVTGREAAVGKLEAFLAKLGATEPELRPLTSHAVMTGAGLPVAGGHDVTTTAALRQYRNERNDRPSVRAKFVGDRPAIFVVRGDLTSGLAGMEHWGIAGFTPTASRQLVANGLLSLLPPPPVTRPATNPATSPVTRPTAAPTASPATAPATAPVAAAPGANG